jgi:DNA-binding LacI/PurR family transcriptional regulator
MTRARLVDVAARAGVSTATVSLVLRGRPGPGEASVAAVRRAAAELGYRPDPAASRLARRRADLVGVVLDVANPFEGELALALDSAAHRVGLDVLVALATPRQAQDEAVEHLVDSRCDAVVILGPRMSSRRLGSIAERVPTIAIGRAGVGGARGVRADDGAGVEAAVDHLVSLGHRRLAYLDGPRAALATVRRRAARQAALRHGVDSLLVVPAGDTEHGGAAAWPLVAEADPGPTAVLAFNDRVAIGCRDSALRAGVDVPRGLSLVGYDDSPPARLATVDLTSVSQNPEQLARACAGLLAEVRDTGTLPPGPDLVVPPRLVVRGSTAAPSRGAAPGSGR